MTTPPTTIWVTGQATAMTSSESIDLTYTVTVFTGLTLSCTTNGTGIISGYSSAIHGPYPTVGQTITITGNPTTFTATNATIVSVTGAETNAVISYTVSGAVAGNTGTVTAMKILPGLVGENGYARLTISARSGWPSNIKVGDIINITSASTNSLYNTENEGSVVAETGVIGTSVRYLRYPLTSSVSTITASSALTAIVTPYQGVNTMPINILIPDELQNKRVMITPFSMTTGLSDAWLVSMLQLSQPKTHLVTNLTGNAALTTQNSYANVIGVIPQFGDLQPFYANFESGMHIFDINMSLVNKDYFNGRSISNIPVVLGLSIQSIS
jgi:hypothetical protein